MTAFTPPVRDLLFVMNEIGDLPGVLALPGHAEATPDLVETIVEEAGKFAAGELAPLNVIGDRQGNKWADGVVTTAPGVAAAYRDFVDNGWAALGANQDFGGQGMPHIVSLAGRRALGQRQSGVVALPHADARRRYGDREPRQRRAEGGLSAKNDFRRMDRHDEPDRAAGRLRPRRHSHARGSRRRRLSHHRHENLHHLGRA